ncbi:MAG TPA: hypothetical protein VF135_13990, partial [Terriglobales bacterium]
MREPLESGFERGSLICSEYLNADLDRAPPTSFEGISKSVRRIGWDFRSGGQLPTGRTAVANLDVPDHREVVGCCIAEFRKQPLTAGGLSERELRTRMNRPQVILVPTVGGQREDRTFGPQTKESIVRDFGDIHAARLTE